MADVEPMDIDAIESDFDNKENAFQYNNVMPRTPCTEKGYEELDVSELNMKLRYSVTPAASPMSKSFTGPYLDNRSCNSDDPNNAVGAENGNLTRSLNSTLTKTESMNKSKILPLQTLSTDVLIDSNRNTSLRHMQDPSVDNIVISVSNTNDIDENLSLGSPCSSVPDTPEATTPTKEMPKPEGSPIMRGLKSVLSMFRPSHSPIQPTDDKAVKQEVISTVDLSKSDVETVQVSTPVAENKQKDANSSKRSSPLKDSLVFNDDLTRELRWKDEKTVFFKEERIPVSKLFFHNPIPAIVPETLNTSVEHMDISCDEFSIEDKANKTIEPRDQSIKNVPENMGESDNEFLDCETTFTKNESFVINNKLKVDDDDEVHMKENITVDSSNNAEIKKEINAECKDNLKNSDFVTPGDITACADELCLSSTDISKTDNKTLKIIEATNSLLNSERIDYRNICDQHNVNLLNESRELQAECQNLTLSVDNQTCEASLDYLKGETKELQQTQCCFVEKLLNNCVANHERITNETLPIPETKERNESIDVNADDPNIKTPSMPNSEDTTVFLNNNTNENTVNFTSAVDNSDNVEDIVYRDESINQDKIIIPILNDSYTNVDNIESSNIAVNSNNFEQVLGEDHKVIDSMPITKTAWSGNNLPIDTNISPLVEDLVNPNILLTVPYEVLNDTINIDSNLDLPEINKTNISFDNNILKNEKESFSLQNPEENVIQQIDDNIKASNILTNSTCAINIVSNSVNEIQLGNNLEISKSPSEIPLPEEDNFEENILEFNDMCKKQSNQKDITEMKICDLDSRVKSEILLNNIKCEQSMVKFGQIDESVRICPAVNPTIESYKIEITDSKPPFHEEKSYIQTDISKNAHLFTLEGESIAMKRENIELDNPNCDVQIEGKNVLHEEKYSKSILGTEEQEFPNTDITKNMEQDNVINIPLKEKDTIEVVVSNEKDGNITMLDKKQFSNEVTMNDDNHKDVTFEKKVDDIDEEIITSANNSPYVSVTDLDKVVEKVPNNTSEEIDYPVTTNTSRSTSPKIVSKGYNFNFDEIDDPFATKTKIRMSPTPDNFNQSCPIITKQIQTTQEVSKKVNKRRSQTERKSTIQKKNTKSKATDKLNTKELPSQKQNNSILNTPREVLDNLTSYVKDNLSERKPEKYESTDVQYDNVCQIVDDRSISVSSNNERVASAVDKEEVQIPDVEPKSLEQTLVISAQKSTSSSEQYFSLGTSSGESSSVMNKSKNVFNLPEIDDVNFNPFATKSRMRMSPPLSEKSRNELESINDVPVSPYVMQREISTNSSINKNTEDTPAKKIGNDSTNTSNTSISSKNTNDINCTIRELATEDEDTIEGPMLEFDDLKGNLKVSNEDIDTNIMNSEEIPHPERDENLENGELFIDADAFEFLLNQNKSSTVLDSGKESLFLKFDPLFAKRVSSDGILAALSKVQKSTPKKITKLKQQDFISMGKSIAGPSNIENCGPVEEYNEDLSSTVTKPMMVVNPAVSSVISHKKPVTPKLNRRSLTFTSPAMAVIDRLLSLSGNASHLDNDASVSHTGREHSETDLAIIQLRELLAEKEISVHTLRSESKELKDRLATLEVQVRGLETESAERLAKINDLSERLLEKTKINKSMAIVVEEYERTIASLIAETEHDKKCNAEERMRLIKERDEQTAHLTSMEVSFSDLHSKYEKSKQIILSCKANEDIYKKSIKEFQDNFSKMQNNYELLKQHATSKLNHANQELERMNRAHEAEVLKMNAMIKRKELHITSLEETLAQKTKANEELTAICDELINKVG